VPPLSGVLWLLRGGSRRMEPQPRMIPRWISGQAPTDVGQMVSDWPCGQSSWICSRVSVVPTVRAGGTVFEVGDVLPEVAGSEGAM